MSGRRRVRIEQEMPGVARLADLRERPAPPFPWLRTLAIALLVVAGLAGTAVGVIRALIDTEAMKADAEAALRHITGRAVRIVGPLTIQSYFGATVAVDDIQIPNLPGAAQPLIARIGRLEAELSLMSLLTSTIDVQRLVVVQPDVLLSIDADGSGNWGSDPAATMPPPAGTFRTWPRNLHIKDGRLTVVDARSNRTTVLALRRISAAEVESGGQLGLSADLAHGTQRIALSGQIGSLARLIDRTATTPWPLRLAMDTLGARLVVAGTFRQPLALAGYSLRVDASVADSTALAPLIPVRLPTLRTVVATARLADTGGPWPDIAGLRLQLGASDLGLWVPGLKVDALELNVPGLDQPSRGELLGTLHGVPVRVQAALGGLAAFLPGATPAPDTFPIDISADMGESRLTLKGGIARPAERRGLDLAAALRIRDLELFSPVVGQRLPPMRNIAFDARIADGQGGFLEGLSITGATMAVPQGDLAGDFTVQFAGPNGGRPVLRGRLKGNRLDADALVEPISALIGPVSLFTAESILRPVARVDARLIPNRTLGLDALGQADLDLTLDLGEFRLLTATYTGLAAQLRLADGRLALDPVTADLPGGRATLRLLADGRDPRHPIALRATIPGVPVQPLLAWSSRRDNLFGTVELDADLRAEGDTLRALAATVTGHLAAAIVEGDIDARLLLDPLAEVMMAARVPVNLGTALGSLSRLRCLAGRLEANAGRTEIATFAIDAGRIQFTAQGGFDLRDETLALRLRPSLRGTALTAAVPLRLAGSFAQPRLTLALLDEPAPRAPPPPVVQTPGGARPPETAAGGLRAPEMRQAAEMTSAELPEICAPALEIARAGRLGPLPGDRDSRPTMVRPGPPRPLQR